MQRIASDAACIKLHAEATSANLIFSMVSRCKLNSKYPRALFAPQERPRS
jgi:hypothetical protein